MTIRDSYTYDNLTLLKDAGAITVDGAATVGGQARVLDLGDAAKTDGKLVVDVSAYDIAQADETYRAILQLCNAIGFGSLVMEGATILINGTGRFTAPFSTRIGATNYRYARLYLDVGGTTPSLNFTAFLAKD